VSEARFWARIALLSLAAAGVVFYGVMSVSLRGGNVTMPDLKGLPKAGADSKLQGLGLQLQVREERYSNTSAYSAVLEQSVEPGATIKRGRVIAVVVSLGSQTLEVPQLQGMPSSRQARLLLEQNGLVLGAEDHVASEEPLDTVLAQAPESGQSVARGDQVSLLVSAGPLVSARVMPDFTGQSLDKARDLANHMGLVLRRVIEAADKAGVPGSVLAQSLTPSARVETGQDLVLTVVPGADSLDGARLSNFSYELPEDGVQERRVRITVTDSHGQRLVHNAMEQPGSTVAREVRVYGPAKLSISVGGQVVEEKDLP
jgi:beta-lactam-binding protein with PASTA domain